MIRKFKMYENLRKGFLGFHRYFRRRKDVTQCGKINMIRNTLLVLYQRVRISISTTFFIQVAYLYGVSYEIFNDWWIYEIN